MTSLSLWEVIHPAAVKHEIGTNCPGTNRQQYKSRTGNLVNQASPKISFVSPLSLYFPFIYSSATKQYQKEQHTSKRYNYIKKVH